MRGARGWVAEVTLERLASESGRTRTEVAEDVRVLVREGWLRQVRPPRPGRPGAWELTVPEHAQRRAGRAGRRGGSR